MIISQKPWTDGSMQPKKNNKNMPISRQYYIPRRNGINSKLYNAMEDLDAIQMMRQYLWMSIHLSLHTSIRLIQKQTSEGIKIRENASIAVEKDTWPENAHSRKHNALNRNPNQDLRNPTSIKNNRCSVSKCYTNKPKSEP
jgi:hypothetical protein